MELYPCGCVAKNALFILVDQIYNFVDNTDEFLSYVMLFTDSSLML